MTTDTAQNPPAPTPRDARINLRLRGADYRHLRAEAILRDIPLSQLVRERLAMAVRPAPSAHTQALTIHDDLSSP